MWHEQLDTLPSSLQGFQKIRTLSHPARERASHQVELWQNDAGQRLVIKRAAAGNEHTLTADSIGEKIFTRAGLPCPPSVLSTDDAGQSLLIMTYMDGFQDFPDANHLPPDFQQNPTIKRGLLYDVWLHMYDRQPYNFMAKDDTVIFIDFGGGLTSSPSGKIKGFPPEINEQALYRCLKKFNADECVNEAYAQVIDVAVDTRTIIIRDPEALRKELPTLQSRFDDATIETLVEQNVIPLQHQNPNRVSRILQEMHHNLGLTLEEFQKKFDRKDFYYPSYRQNFREALETFTAIRDNFDNDESAYLSWALKKRRDNLIAFVNQRV